MAKSKFIQAPPRKHGKYRINAANAYNLCIFASAVVSFLGRWELGCTSLKVTPSGETQKVQIPPLVILKFCQNCHLNHCQEFRRHSRLLRYSSACGRCFLCFVLDLVGVHGRKAKHTKHYHKRMNKGVSSATRLSEINEWF